MWLAVLTESGQRETNQSSPFIPVGRAIKSCSSFYKKSCSEISIAISSVLSYLTNAFVACTLNAKRPSAKKIFVFKLRFAGRGTLKSFAIASHLRNVYVCFMLARFVFAGFHSPSKSISQPEESRGGL